MVGSGGGGRINKPKSSICKKNGCREKKLKIKVLKRLAPRGRSMDTLANTTEHMLRQSRTNPRANVHLSGKKKRTLLKEAKRLLSEKAKMDILPESTGQTTKDSMETS